MATTVPAPSLPTGSDRPTRADRARTAPSESGAVTMGRSGVPSIVEALMSAPANNSPRSDGLIGAASTRISTWLGPGDRHGDVDQRELQCALLGDQ